MRIAYSKPLSRARRRIPRAFLFKSTCATLAFTFGLTACDGILKVELPGELPEESLTEPGMLGVVMNGVQADFECAYGNYATFTALYTDELIAGAGTFPTTSIATRGTQILEYGSTACTNSANTGQPGNYLHLQVARTAAERSIRIIGEHPDDVVPNRNEMLATSNAYSGYSLTMLGEGFCRMAIDGGPEMQPAEVLAVAEERFTRAIDHARLADADDIVNWARVGRARVQLQLGKTAEALADAQAIPEGFVKYATHDATPPRRGNRLFYYLHAARSGSLHPELRNLEVGGVADTRLVAVDLGVKAADAITDLWVPGNRFASASEPVPIANWEEAQLIIAEIQGGPEAVAAINRLRDAANPNLPHFSSADPAEIRAEILEERRRVLFGQGHRIADILRFPELDLPQGVNHKGQPYNTGFTCMPLPLAEVRGNPNITE